MMNLCRSGSIILIVLIAASCAQRANVEAPSNEAVMAEMGELHEVIIKQVVMGYVDGGGMAPVVILVNKENDEQIIPIWVGLSEGRAIDMALNKQISQRPGTHDLFASVLGKFRMNMVRVVVSDLRDNTYFAIITMESNGVIKEIDSRPSDAMALAVRFATPIFVSEEVIRKSGWVKPLKHWEEKDKESSDKEEDSGNLL
jgi:bifunctional DNase/RNase